MKKGRKDKGYKLDPEVLRLRALPRRPLTAADIPGEPWREDYANYQLRSDGVIESGMVGALAEVRPDGCVAWYR